MSHIATMHMKDIVRAAGGASKLANAVNRHRASVLGWTRVPAEHAAAVSAATGIPRHILRPDLWEPPDAAALAAPFRPSPVLGGGAAEVVPQAANMEDV